MDVVGASEVQADVEAALLHLDADEGEEVGDGDGAEDVELGEEGRGLEVEEGEGEEDEEERDGLLEVPHPLENVPPPVPRPQAKTHPRAPHAPHCKQSKGKRLLLELPQHRNYFWYRISEQNSEQCAEHSEFGKNKCEWYLLRKCGK